MKNREIEFSILVSLAIIIPLIAFATGNSNTGQAISIGEKTNTEVVVQGIAFIVVEQGVNYDYIFSDDNNWYSSRDGISWSLKPKLGNTLSQGLFILKAQGNILFFQGNEIVDVIDFTKNFK